VTTVVHVLEALEGGTARHVTDLVRHGRGVAHHVVVPRRRVGGVTDEAAVPVMQEFGAEVHHVEMRRLPTSPRNLTAFNEIRSLLRRIRPDVVHGHSAVGGALGRVAAADLDTLRVYTPNGLHPSPVATTLERALRPLTHRLIAVSRSEAVVAVARGISDPDHVAVVPNGIEPDAPSADRRLRDRIGITEGAVLAGFVGRLAPQKAPEVIVEVAVALADRNPDVHFVIIGSGRREAAVRRAVSGLGLESSVHLLSYVPGAARLMGELDAFLLPSRYEGCPYTVLEAMRAGTPVVVSDAVGNRDVVTDGVTGRVVRVGDAAGTADALAAVLEGGLSVDAMVSAARKHVAAHHDVHTAVAKVLALYSGAPADASSDMDSA